MCAIEQVSVVPRSMFWFGSERTRVRVMVNATCWPVSRVDIRRPLHR
jgi:hypothetical protein